MALLFDLQLRSARRDRAARLGVDAFLYDRGLADIVERLALVPRRFERALLIGALGATDALLGSVGRLEVRDPGPLLAVAACGQPINEEDWDFEPGAFDLIVALSTLDTLNALPLALAAMRVALAPDGLLIGAMSGGDTLPQLRTALRAADAVAGEAQPHVHPRIEASALAGLLADVGLVQPVVDIDRVRVSYATLRSLVADLRAMGATNVLTQRPRRGITRAALVAAERHFAAAGNDGRTTEIFEFLHFAAWTPRTA